MSNYAYNKITESLDLSLFSENLRSLMFKSKIDSARLSEQTGIAVSTLNSLKRGEGNPTLSTLLSLANFFNISLSDLAENSLSGNKVKDSSQFEIPLLEITEIGNYFDHKLENISTIADDLQNEDAAFCFAIKINNNSLAPIFDKGTTFILATNKRPQDGDIVLVQFGNNLPCFRRIFIEGNSYFFKSISDLVNTKAIVSSDFLIRGVVLKAIQVF